MHIYVGDSKLRDDGDQEMAQVCRTSAYVSMTPDAIRSVGIDSRTYCQDGSLSMAGPLGRSPFCHLLVMAVNNHLKRACRPMLCPWTIR